MALFYTPTTSINLEALSSKYLPDFPENTLSISLIGSLVRTHIKKTLPPELQVGRGHVESKGSLSPFQEVIIYDPSQNMLYQQEELIIVPEKAVKISIQIVGAGKQNKSGFQHGKYLSVLWWLDGQDTCPSTPIQKLGQLLSEEVPLFPFDLMLLGEVYYAPSYQSGRQLLSYRETTSSNAHPENILLTVITDYVKDIGQSVLDISLDEFGWAEKKTLPLHEINTLLQATDHARQTDLVPQGPSLHTSSLAVSIPAALRAEIENNDINLQDENGNTLLHRKAKSGNLLEVKALLRADAAISIKNKDGNTPLHEAVNQNQEAVTAILIDYGADVNAKNYKHNTPLHYAASMNLDEIVYLLIKKRANIELKNKEGLTPLHVSAKKGSYTSGLALIENRASIEANTLDGLTALHLAASHGQAELSQLLLDKGADLNALTEEKESALHLAASHGHVKLIKLLINNHADVSITNSKGETYLQCISYA